MARFTDTMLLTKAGHEKESFEKGNKKTVVTLRKNTLTDPRPFFPPTVA
jgi:hypothetical protein